MTHIIEKFELEISSINGSLNAMEEVLFLKNHLYSGGIPLIFRIGGDTYSRLDGKVVRITISAPKGTETDIAGIQHIWDKFLPWLGFSSNAKPGPESLALTKTATVILLDKKKETIAHMWSADREFSSIVTNYKRSH